MAFCARLCNNLMSRIEVCLGGLSSVLSDLDLVLERFDDERSEAALHQVVELAEKLSDLIGDLVDDFEEGAGSGHDLVDDQASQPSPSSPQSGSDE